MKTFEGHYGASGHKYALVASRFNRPITQLLLEGVTDCLERHGALAADLTVAWVPGAFELAPVAKKMARSKKYDGVICVGAVIRGETAHFDYVASGAASGIMQVSLEVEDIPVIFSVLTTETKEQAEVRAGTKGVNVGFQSALALIEMVNLYRSLKT